MAQVKNGLLSHAARFCIGFAGLSGALGVASAAAASHSAGMVNLEIASRFALIHAATFCGLAALAPSCGRVAGAAMLVLAVGVMLFCGDLASLDLLGHRLFPFAAPTGGTLLIAGWVGLFIAALAGFPARRDNQAIP